MEDDDALVTEEAQKWVRQYGSDTPEVLRELMGHADLEGDELSAQTWRDIAEAARAILARS